LRTKYTVKAKKSWSMMHRDAIRSAVDFSIRQYDLAGKGKTIVKMCAHAGEFGSAVSLHEDVYMIFINAQQRNLDIAVQTVFHEMWHVYQYIHDGLDLETNQAFWRGTVIDINVNECSHDEYWELPWEVEARVMEEKMFKIYTS
jgi:hypothetical protein